MNANSIWLIAVSIILMAGPVAAAEQNGIKSGKVMPGVYSIGTNGGYHEATNSLSMWPGVWRENTNGWRVQLYCWNTSSPDVWVSVAIGNTAINTGGGYFWTPDERFAKFELMDSNNVAVNPKKGMTLEAQFPSRLSIHAFPKLPNGRLKNHMGFFTNSPPWVLKQFRIHDIYQIKNEGDYTLTVCAVIYKFGTNTEHFANKIDLPCVSTKIHLKPE